MPFCDPFRAVTPYCLPNQQVMSAWQSETTSTRCIVGGRILPHAFIAATQKRKSIRVFLMRVTTDQQRWPAIRECRVVKPTIWTVQQRQNFAPARKIPIRRATGCFLLTEESPYIESSVPALPMPSDYRSPPIVLRFSHQTGA